MDMLKARLTRRRQAGVLDQVVELVGQVGRGQRLAVLACEDPALGRDADLDEVAFLSAAMRAQDDDRLRVQGDRAEAGFRLQLACPQLPVGSLLELPGDVGDSLVQVQVIPGKSARLAAGRTST